ncbi:MAG: hypothetical protein HY609_01670 [Deltaproteobacteria bacterium]|nr:hypothetical protein [Deltaproteobacteria bacterium]
MDRQTLIYRKWPPPKRLQAAFELYQLAQEMIRTREKRRCPNLSAMELEKRVRLFFR